MIQVVLLSVFIVLVLVVVYLLLTSRGGYDSDLSSDVWQQRWQRIEQYLNSRTESEWRLAVIEADKFLDSMLKFKGIGGNSLGERLKIAQSKFKELKAVWPAHLLRNRLVHESDYALKAGQARQAVSSFYKAAKILGFKKS